MSFNLPTWAHPKLKNVQKRICRRSMMLRKTMQKKGPKLSLLFWVCHLLINFYLIFDQQMQCSTPIWWWIFWPHVNHVILYNDPIGFLKIKNALSCKELSNTQQRCTRQSITCQSSSSRSIMGAKYVLVPTIGLPMLCRNFGLWTLNFNFDCFLEAANFPATSFITVSFKLLILCKG